MGNKTAKTRGPFLNTIDGRIAKATAYLEWFDSGERARTQSRQSDEIVRARVASELAVLKQAQQGVNRTVLQAIQRRDMMSHHARVRAAEADAEVETLHDLRRNGLLTE